MDLVEQIKSCREGSYYELVREPYGRLVVSEEGLRLIESVPQKTEQILVNLHARISDLERVDRSDPLAADLGDIFYGEEEDDAISSSVFVIGFNPEAKKAEDRYKLAAVDIGRR